MSAALVDMTPEALAALVREAVRAELAALRPATPRAIAQAQHKAPKLLSLREVARLYRIDRSRVSDDVTAGLLPCRKNGKAIYVSAARAADLYGA